jgi:DNA-binding transcriptional MerR regulator
MFSSSSEYTVDELAVAADLRSSTIRMYQRDGLLHPPSRRGRVAYYDSSHLDRLRLIGRLKDRGFSLAGIKELIDASEAGLHLDSFVPQDVPSLDDLLKRIARAEALTPELIARSVDLGLLRISEGGEMEADPQDIAIGASLLDLGVPADIVLDEYEALLESTDTIATRFADLFEAQIWTGDTGPPMTDLLERLIHLARQIVDLALVRSIQHEGRRRWEELTHDGSDAE